MDEGFKKWNIRNKGEFSKKTQDGMLRFVEASATNILSEIKKESIPAHEIFGLEDESMVDAVKDYLREDFAKRGFSDVAVKPVVFLEQFPSEEGVVLGDDFGSVVPSHVEVRDLEIAHDEVRKLMVLRTLAHELYHSTAANRVEAIWKSSGSDKKLVLNQQTGFIGYSKERGREVDQPSSALEEGLAVLFEMRAFEKIKKLFPADVVQDYQDEVNSVLESTKESGRNFLLSEGGEQSPIYEYTPKISFQDFGKGAGISLNDPYYHSAQLVQFLSSKIENFDFLVEDARLNRHTMGFNRAIEKKFGMDLFRRIVTCAPEEARDLLDELKELNP